MGRKLFLAGAATIVLAGCGTTKTVTSTEATRSTVSITDTTTNTITHTRKISSLPPVTTTQTQTTTVTSPPPSERSFAGNGGENLGTIHVPVDSILHWTSDGGLFSVSDPDDTGIFVNSQGGSGTSAVAAGTYRGVSINADGNWTIQITAR